MILLLFAFSQGWVLMSANCEGAGTNAAHIYTVLRTAMNIDTGRPGHFCTCNYDGSSAVQAGNVGECITRIYICRSAVTQV